MCVCVCVWCAGILEQDSVLVLGSPNPNKAQLHPVLSCSLGSGSQDTEAGEVSVGQDRAARLLQVVEGSWAERDETL